MAISPKLQAAKKIPTSNENSVFSMTIPVPDHEEEGGSPLIQKSSIKVEKVRLESGFRIWCGRQ